MSTVCVMMTGLKSWAAEEFGDADLGDPRRTRRAVELAAAMAARPGGRVTEVLGDLGEREGAFRLLRNRAVDEKELARSSHEATIGRLSPGEDFVVAVDQTGVAVTDERGTKGLGRAGSNAKERVRGLQVMNALALHEDGSTLGICAQSWWKRSDKKAPTWNEDCRPLSKRESYLWHQAIDQTEQRIEEANHSGRAWYQLDRGGDSHHVLQKARDEQLRITIRVAHDRALIDDSRSMKELVSRSRVKGRITHYLARGAARRAGHRPTRPRKLSVRASKVHIRLTEYRPKYRKTAMELWVVHVRERTPPRRSERLEWFLLTTYPVETRHDALKVAQNYCLRWRVEEFHKTWKTGACNLEGSQLRSPKTLKTWATLHSAVAARIERLKQTSRSAPDSPALEIASRTEIDAAILLTKRCRWKPGDELTASQFVLLVANLGGYTGKSSGGPPGAIVIRRGFERVETSAQTLEALAELKM